MMIAGWMIEAAVSDGVSSLPVILAAVLAVIMIAYGSRDRRRPTKPIRKRNSQKELSLMTPGKHIAFTAPGAAAVGAAIATWSLTGTGAGMGDPGRPVDAPAACRNLAETAAATLERANTARGYLSMSPDLSSRFTVEGWRQRKRP